MQCIRKNVFLSQYSFFHQTLINLFKRNFPEEMIKICYKNRLPFITSGLKKSIHQKHRLWQNYLTNPTEDNLIKSKIYNNKLTSLLRKSERDYYEKKFDLLENDVSKGWKVIKEIIGKNSKNNISNIKLNINGESITDLITICNAFNNYFVEIGPKLAKNIKCTENPLRYVKHSLNSMYLPDVDENEIINIINSLKNSSAGWDALPAFLAKRSVKYFIQPLTYLINQSIRLGIFPDELKIAKVIPLFKSGDKCSISNYRPISILPFFPKCLKKLFTNI